MSLVFCPGNVEFVVRVAQDPQFSSIDFLSLLGQMASLQMFECGSREGPIFYDGLPVYYGRYRTSAANEPRSSPHGTYSAGQ